MTRDETKEKSQRKIEEEPGLSPGGYGFWREDDQLGMGKNCMKSKTDRRLLSSIQMRR